MSTSTVTKSVHVRVEQLVEHVPGYDERREMFRVPAVAPWVPGRLTLTRDRLSWVAARPGLGAWSTSVDLTEIEAVEIAPGRLPSVVTLRTDDRLIHLRMVGAAPFAKRVAIAREAARSRVAR